ncbi:GGDEF domain-containing protein [Deinococcus apachensis]|uniref:GGDEF domain-containing protein n=1 Tax=Deinococcus apachensis TaxID=309886 RepID=UPI0009FD1EC0|nr:GGDEF domain-containing protein [Deinococcus apachensis]
MPVSPRRPDLFSVWTHLGWHLRTLLVVAGLVLLARLCGQVLGPDFSAHFPFLPFFSFIALCAYLRRGWGGLYATVLSTLLIRWVDMPPPVSTLSLTIFALQGLVITGIIASLHHLNRRLGQSLADLQQVNAELAEVQAELNVAAYSDTLTHLGNRRAFEGDLESCYAALQTGTFTFCLALMDLDGLKQINDTHGHLRGDALLRAFASSLQSALPSQVRLYRFGGDEFAVIWPELPASEVYRIVQAVRNAEHFTRDVGFPFIGASLGVVCVPDETRTVLEALELGDRRLYEQKNIRRRSRVA